MHHTDASPRWFDSHCHLHLCGEGRDLGDVVERARAAGVTGLLTVGIDAESNQTARDLAHEFGIWASAGIHPNSATAWDRAARAAVEALLGDERVVAVGETGLDFHRDYCPAEVQHTAFSDHIALAKEHGKALVIHTRSSTTAAIEQLEDDGPPERLVFHCWSGDVDELERALGLGAYVSFAGNVTFKSAEDLRAAALRVPAERLLVETDSPYLAPVPHRGSPNEPAFVADTGTFLAELRDEDVVTFAAATAANARSLLGPAT